MSSDSHSDPTPDADSTDHLADTESGETKAGDVVDSEGSGLASVPAQALPDSTSPAIQGLGAAGSEGEAEIVPPKPPGRHVSTRRGGSGLHIPGYRIEGVIGRGSTGTVYRARQETVDRVVALKVLHAELTSRPRMVRRLQREARTTARLAHPHIVSAIDMGRTGDRWWFAMELVDGPSLALKLRQEGRLNEREALRFFIPLCESLVHIWENGVVHRDIKPGNILIDKVSGARLADLGLAFADDDPSLTGSEGTLGTPHYISPEQTRDPSAVDIRTDLWSFGATLFHAVCGAPPFSGANVAEVLSGVLYGRVPDPLELEPDLSRGLGLVIRKCLSRDFEKRYQTPRELLIDLERVRERRRPKVRAASLEPTAGAGPSALKIAAISAMVMVVLGGAFLLWKRPWEDTAGPALFGPLTVLGNQLQGDLPAAERLAPAVLVERLRDIKVQVPASDLDRWLGIFSEAGDLEAKELMSVYKESEAEFREALAKSDFAGAERALSTNLESALLARVGRPHRSAPYEYRVRLDRLTSELESKLSEEESGLRAKVVSNLENGYFANVEQFIAKGHWRAAGEILAETARTVAGGLAVELGGLPEASQERLLATISTRLNEERADFQRRWSVLDDDLVRWVDFATREYFRELERTHKPMSAGPLLRDDFAKELIARGLKRDQMMTQESGLALSVLAKSASDLEIYEASLALGISSSGQDALDAMGVWLDDLASEGAWTDRRYSAAGAYWEQRQVWLAANSGSSSEPWHRDLEARVNARIMEATLLGRLIRRASDRIEGLHSKKLELLIGYKVIASGTVEVISAAPTGGFYLDVTGGSSRLMYLAVPKGGLPADAALVSAKDVLDLANLDLDEDWARLATAFFYAREGDANRALDLLTASPLGLEFGPKAAEFLRSLEHARSDFELRQQRRATEAQQQLNTLFFDLPGQIKMLESYPERALDTIELLLSEYGDVPLIANSEDRLSELRERLKAPEGRATLEEFQRAYGYDTVNFHHEGQVELFYDFVLEANLPGISREDWMPDGAGWAGPANFADDADFTSRLVPSLVIRKPLEADTGVTTVEFEIEEPSNAGKERLLVASALGFHVVLSLPKGASAGRILAVTKGSAAKALEELRAGGGRQLDDKLLEGTGLHSHWGESGLKRVGCLLRLDINKRSGSVRVLFDGVEVLQSDLSPPGSGAGTYGIRLRALEQIHLRSLRVRAKR